MRGKVADMAMTLWAGEAKISPTVEKDSGEGDWAGFLGRGSKHERSGDHKIRWLPREQRNVHRQPAGEGIAHIHGSGNKRFQKRQSWKEGP